MQSMKLLSTGIPHLDDILDGGIPIYSLNILGGQPGAGKTILSQNILFNYAHTHPNANVLYLGTLSEPLTKVVRYMQHFTFFDSALFGTRVHFEDIGFFIREHGLARITDHMLGLVDSLRPDVLIIDSFRAIRDMSDDHAEFRRFCYDLSIKLTGARCTTFLVGEYDSSTITEHIEFAVADGIFYLGISHENGEYRRFLQIHKLRGRPFDMHPYPITITNQGIRILSANRTIHRQEPVCDQPDVLAIGISGVDQLLHGGIPRGHSVILSGVSGSGKTTWGLQFLIHGAQQGERGVLFSFEETPARLYRLAEGFGWNLRDLHAHDLLRIVFIPQTTIHIEEHLEDIVDMVTSFHPARLVIDSFSVFLHRAQHAVVHREKTVQVATLIQRTGTVGILISDIPTNEPHRISRSGIEETVVDGVIVLSTHLDGTKRRRYLEIFKMRGINHHAGRHRMQITPHGIELLYSPETHVQALPTTPSALSFEPLAPLFQAQLTHGFAWLVQGEPGFGKSRLACQFAIEGLRANETVVLIAADAPSYQMYRIFEDMGGEPHRHRESGRLYMLDCRGSSPESLDMSDADALLFTLCRYVTQLPRPLRIVFDSLLPLSLEYATSDFVTLIHRKNRLLRHPEVTLFDTLASNMLTTTNLNTMLHAFDILIDLATPGWGDMEQGRRFRALHVRTAPIAIDTRPYPYAITQTDGIVIQHDFYAE